MTTGWLITNMVLATIVAAVVAIPAVFIPLRLHDETRMAARIAQRTRETTPTRRWESDGQQREAA